MRGGLVHTELMGMGTSHNGMFVITFADTASITATFFVVEGTEGSRNSYGECVESGWPRTIHG